MPTKRNLTQTPKNPKNSKISNALKNNCNKRKENNNFTIFITLREMSQKKNLNF